MVDNVALPIITIVNCNCQFLYIKVVRPVESWEFTREETITVDFKGVSQGYSDQHKFRLITRELSRQSAA